MVRVVFEDDYLLVIDKPPGLVTTRSETQSQTTLQDYLEKNHSIRATRSGIVHRLDKDTSGLLVVGKSDEIVAKLQSQFKNRTVEKEYLALVHGFIDDSGKINAPISRNPGDREKFIVDDEGEIENSRQAVTEYNPIQLLVMSSESIEKAFHGFTKIQLRKLKTMNYEQFTLLSAHPLTGRTHQIRVHLKYIGHSIVSDQKYGGRKVVRFDLFWCPRQFLHAAKLAFNHPVSGERMKFESDLPEDLGKALSLLTKRYTLVSIRL